MWSSLFRRSSESHVRIGLLRKEGWKVSREGGRKKFLFLKLLNNWIGYKLKFIKRNLKSGLSITLATFQGWIATRVTWLTTRLEAWIQIIFLVHRKHLICEEKGREEERKLPNAYIKEKERRGKKKTMTTTIDQRGKKTRRMRVTKIRRQF